MSIVPISILYFIACFAAGWYFADSQYKGRKIKKLEEESFTLRAAKAELDKIRNPTPEQMKEAVGNITAPIDSRTITYEVCQRGIEEYDRILIKAPGRKDRVVLLRPWSRKMAKAKPVKNSDDARPELIGRIGKWAENYETLGINLLRGEKFKVLGVSAEGNYSVETKVEDGGMTNWFVEPHCVHESLLEKPVKIKPTRPSRKKSTRSQN